MTNLNTDGPAQIASPDSVAKLGLYVVLVAFGGFLLWAGLVPLSEGVISVGQVVVDGKRKAVQHLEGGIVSAIHVAEGDHVAAGDVLIEISQTQNQAQQDLLLTRYYSNLAIIDRLKSERFGAQAIAYGDELLSRSSDPRVNDLIVEQNHLFDARKAQARGQVMILEQRIAQIERQISGLESEKASKEEEISFIIDELTRVVSLHQRGLIGLPRLLDQRKSLSQAEGAAGRTEADIAAAQVEIGRTRLEILQLDRNHQNEIAEGILESQTQLFEVNEQLAAVADILERTIVGAPQSGKVMGLNVWTVGGVIPPGAQILEILPDDRRLVIEARIRTTDIDNVHVGMPARARFLGLKQRTTPALNGTIEDVSGDIMTDEASGEVYYMAKVSISETELSRITGSEIIPGMPVEILIEAGTRTALEYLTDPVLDVVRRSMTES